MGAIALLDVSDVTGIHIEPAERRDTFRPERVALEDVLDTVVLGGFVQRSGQGDISRRFDVGDASFQERTVDVVVLFIVYHKGM